MPYHSFSTVTAGVHALPGHQLGLQEPLKLGGIGVLKTTQLMQALLDQLNPTQSIGAYSTQCNGLSTHNQPFLSPSHSSVEELQWV